MKMKWRLRLLSVRGREKTWLVDESKSADEFGLSFEESVRQVHRYIRLTELIFQLLDKVDDGITPVTDGAAFSYLDTKNQVKVNDYIEMEVCGVSIKQAKLIRDSYINDSLNVDNMNKIFAEE